MIYVKSLILLFITTFVSIFYTVDVYSLDYFFGLETQIHEDSSINKVKKLQKAFIDFWLYDWKVDWNFSSIERQLLNYQKKTWIIKYDNDWWAWYFWVKTLRKLKKDYINSFEEITNKYLKIDKPALWERFFYVTAYYSPSLDQSRYSYSSKLWRYRTYKEEIRLQWEWKRWASWKKVFYWMLAAPRNYRFWTKIELEWIWVWSVQDRWQAIVNSWERWYNWDRIDIRMWYWDQWLERALKWWKRKVKWKIVPDSTKLSIQFNDSFLAWYSNLKVTPESKSDYVKKLQTLLKKLDIYNWKVDWKYNNIKDTLIRFQVKNAIIKSINSEEAWYFWKKTLAVLRKKYSWNIFVKQEKSDNVILTWVDIDNLKNIRTQISKYVIKKSMWDVYKKKKIINNLKNKLEKLAKKTKHRKKQAQFLYLRSII